MNLIFAFDTETTGLIDYKKPSDGPQQPHIVQLAALLADVDTGNVIQSMDVIIKPEGWAIPQETTDVHGISTEHAMDVGVSEKTALIMFLSMWSKRERVAHNQGFDERIIRIACKRFAPNFLLADGSNPDQWKGGTKHCTAMLGKPIMELPPTERMKQTNFRNSFKTPNLTEAYSFFTGKVLQNAHSAMADTQACLDIYLAIKAGVDSDQSAVAA